MKFLFCVFSGTGNTMLATNFLATNLKEYGHEVDIHIVTRPYGQLPDVEQYDIIGLGYPIHAFNAPKIFVDFCHLLPRVSNKKKIFFYKTSGEPFKVNDASSYFIYRHLKKKNYQMILEEHFLMPYNLVFRYKDSLAKQMYLYTKAMAKVMAIKLDKGIEEKPHFNLIFILNALIFHIQWFGAFINGPLMHRKKKRCIKCGLCAKNCPTHNIKMTEEGPKFGWKCSMCMRCAFYCPKDAITIGFLNLWRVNGSYQFDKLLKDENIPSIFVDAKRKGYFKLFRKYYRNADKKLQEYGVSID